MMNQQLIQGEGVGAGSVLVVVIVVVRLDGLVAVLETRPSAGHLQVSARTEARAARLVYVDYRTREVYSARGVGMDAGDAQFAGANNELDRNFEPVR